MVNRTNKGEIETPDDQNLESAGPHCGDTTISLGAQPTVLHAPGTTLLEKFKIIELLGQGGMGSVYRVEHLLMNRQFALKCLNKFQAADAGWRRFQNEAKAAHLLDHPNLLKVYDFGLLPGGQPYFLMELVEGVTLADEIKRLGRLPVERAVKIFIQVAFAIGYAHEHRVVHRDLKPSNIMLVNKKSETDPEVVKVVDFGIAKLTGVDEFNQQTLTKTGEIFGSPLYMSPEQCMGVGVDQRSDLYSLGCVFYESLTSAPPFMGESALSTMMKHQSESQLSLKEASLGMQFPAGLERVIGKLLEKDPLERYQSASQLASDLIHVERTLGIADDQVQTIPKSDLIAKPVRKENDATKQAAPTKKKRITELAAVAAAAFFLGIGVCFLCMQQNKDSSTTAVSSGKALEDPTDPAYDTSVANEKYWSNNKLGKRTFHFPRSNSLGKIVLANGDTYEATGSISVPSHLELGIIASDYLIQHPELMDKFRPGEISVFDFNSSRIARTPFFTKLRNMTELKALNLYDTAFLPEDAKFISNLKNLLYLNLSFTALTGGQILQYAPLSNLNCLDVTYVTDGKAVIPKLSELPRLRQILLICIKLDDDDLKPLSDAGQLKIVDVSWNHITDKGVAYLTKLKKMEYLDLAETRVTPEVWKSLSQMPSLRKVKVAYYKDERWSSQAKRYFAAQMAKNAPSVQIIWKYDDNLDFIAGETDLPWKGSGMQAHKSPILSALTDVDLLAPTNAFGK